MAMQASNQFPLLQFFCNILPKSSISKLKMSVRNLFAWFLLSNTHVGRQLWSHSHDSCIQTDIHTAPTQKRPPVVTCCFSCGVCLVVHPAVSGVGVGTLGRESQKKSVHMWNQGKNCMGRRAFRKSNKSMQPSLKHHGAHYVEVLFLDPWQCTFLLPNFPNPHQDACAQLCPTIFKKYIHGC